VEESSVFYLLEAGEAVSIRFETAVMETFAWILEHPMTGAPRAFLSQRLSGLRMRGPKSSARIVFDLLPR